MLLVTSAFAFLLLTAAYTHVAPLLLTTLALAPSQCTTCAYRSHQLLAELATILDALLQQIVALDKGRPLADVGALLTNDDGGNWNAGVLYAGCEGQMDTAEGQKECDYKGRERIHVAVVVRGSDSV